MHPDGFGRVVDNGVVLEHRLRGVMHFDAGLGWSGLPVAIGGDQIAFASCGFAPSATAMPAPRLFVIWLETDGGLGAGL